VLDCAYVVSLEVYKHVKHREFLPIGYQVFLLRSPLPFFPK